MPIARPTRLASQPQWVMPVPKALDRRAECRAPLAAAKRAGACPCMCQHFPFLDAISGTNEAQGLLGLVNELLGVGPSIVSLDFRLRWERERIHGCVALGCGRFVGNISLKTTVPTIAVGDDLNSDSVRCCEQLLTVVLPLYGGPLPARHERSLLTPARRTGCISTSECRGCRRRSNRFPRSEARR